MAEQIAEQVAGLPAAALRPYVDRYVGYRYEGFAPGIHVGLPSGHLTFVVSLGAPLDVAERLDADAPRQRLTALVGGLHTRPAAIRHDGNQYGVQLSLTPLGARALFGMPAGEIAEQTLPMDPVLGRATGELVDRLRSASTWSQRFAVLDSVLVRSLADTVAVAPQVRFAWRRLTAAGGAVPIATLADEVGWTRRHMTERFRREFGLGPKTAARVVRFDRARRMFVAGHATSLGEVAAAAGYADQAHMNRDWRQFAGASPTQWLADERLPFVQAEEVTRAAHSAA